VAGAAAYAVCRNTGQPIAGNVAATGAVLAAGAETAVKWSQAPMGKAAGQAVTNGAKAVGSAVSSGAKTASCIAGQVCSAAGKTVGNIASSAANAGSSIMHSVTGGGQSEPDLEMGHHSRNAQPEYEYLEAREPFLADELETRDDVAPVYTRYAEPEPEPSWDDLY
jgi:hypothetical protein